MKYYNPGPPTVPCSLCTEPTEKTETKVCDRCWELKWRIRSAPELARKVLAALDAEPKGVGEDKCN
jgi:hypothetical protein